MANQQHEPGGHQEAEATPSPASEAEESDGKAEWFGLKRVLERIVVALPTKVQYVLIVVFLLVLGLDRVWSSLPDSRKERIIDGGVRRAEGWTLAHFGGSGNDALIAAYLAADRRAIERLLPQSAGPYVRGLRALLAAHYQEARLHFDTATMTGEVSKSRVLTFIGASYYLGGRYQNAAESFLKALDEDPKQTNNRLYAAAALFQAARMDSARLMAAIVGDVAQRSKPVDSATIASALVVIGHVDGATGNFSESAKSYHRAEAIRTSLYGAEDPRTVELLYDLAANQYAKGNLDSAKAEMENVLRIQETTLGSDDIHVARTLNTLANTISDQGNSVAAEPLYQRAIDIASAALGEEHPFLASLRDNLATTLEMLKKDVDAEAEYKRVLAMRERLLDQTHPDVGRSLNNLATFYMDRGRLTEAEPLFARSAANLEAAYGSESDQLAYVLSNQGTLYAKQGKPSLAEPVLKRALAIRRKRLPPNSPYIARVLLKIGNLYRDRRNFRQADSVYREALTIAGAPTTPEAIETLANRGVLEFKRGRMKAADSLFRLSLPGLPGVVSDKQFVDSVRNLSSRARIALVKRTPNRRRP
jgi:tetratricopeptide (TPR) repeat protein